MIKPGLILDGKYKILNELGHGGMASVFLAEDLSLGRNVAVKILPETLSASTEAVKSFLNEAKKAAALRHPKIVTVYGVNVMPDGQPYFVIEYLQSSLKDLIKQGPLEPARVVDILSKILDGLYFAHSRGVIHRDLKPENIMFNENSDPVIIDFGIAKTLDSSMTITGEGLTKGTPHYMSPEQCRGKTVDHRSDIYSLGIVMYEMMCGKVPFEAEETTGVMYMHVHEQPDLGPLKVSGSSESLLQVLEKSLSKSPDSRFATAEEFNKALKRCLSDLSADKTAYWTPVIKKNKNYTVSTVLITLVILAGIVMVLTIFKNNAEFERKAENSSRITNNLSEKGNLTTASHPPSQENSRQHPVNPFITKHPKSTVPDKPLQSVVTPKIPSAIVDFEDSIPAMTGLTVTASLLVMKNMPENSGIMVTTLGAGDSLTYLGSKSPRCIEEEIDRKMISGPMLLVKTKFEKTGWVHCAGVKISSASSPSEYIQTTPTKNSAAISVYNNPVQILKSSQAKASNPALNPLLLKAVKDGNYAIAKDLISRGADPGAKENHNWTALIYSIDRKRNDIARLLVESGADINACDRDDNDSPLGYAANRGNAEITRLLILKGADVNHVNKNGHTPLILAAAQYCDIETIKILLAAGADPSKTDNKKRNAAEWARRRKNQKAEQLLNDSLKRK
jgi:serine/threonine-protein kinase PpkA